MCLILFNQPKIDSGKSRKLIGKNLLDYKEFDPLVEMALSGRLNGLRDYCNRANKNYQTKLKQMFEIIEIEHGHYTIILPSFMNHNILIEEDILFKKWCEIVGLLNVEQNK